MAAQPAYLKTLKDYARAQFGDDAMREEVVADLSNESDRGAVILAATGVEDILEWALIQRMPPLQTDAGARNAMFGTNGVCGSFSQKIMLAYALGIIDKPLRKEIDLLREIRNACAHGRLPLSFERPELRDAAKVIIGQMLPDLVDEKPETLRMAFVVATSAIQQSVILGRRVTAADAHRQATKMAGRRAT